MNSTYKTIMESILTAIIAIILTGVLLFVPLINMLIILVPAVYVVLALRRGLGAFFISVLITVIIVGTITQPFIGVFVFWLLIMTVLGVRAGFSGKLLFYESILLATMGVVGSMLTSFWLFSAMFGRDVFDILWNQMRDILTSGIFNIEPILNMYHQWGIISSPMTEAQFAEMIIGEMQIRLPSYLVILSFIVGTLNFFAVRMILKRFKYKLPYVPTFGEWMLPRGMGTGFLIIFVFVFIGQRAGIRNFELVQTTVMAVLGFLFTLQGLAVAWFFLKSGKVPSVLRVIILIPATVFLGMVLTFLGILDQIFRIRRVYKARQG